MSEGTYENTMANTSFNIKLALYGGIPSLIYTFKSGESPEARFQRERNHLVDDAEITASRPPVLRSFIRSVLSGHVSDGRFLRFATLEPETAKMHWPIFYIACIAGLFENVSGCQALADVILKDLPSYAKRTETGLDWELIVQSALLLRSINAQINGSEGPFSIAPKGSHPEVVNITLHDGHKDIDAAKEFVESSIAECTSPTILLFTSAFAKFPHFDGFVCYTAGSASKARTSKARTSRRIIAYQCKTGDDTVKRNNIVPDWIECAYLLRGEAPNTSPGPRGKPKWKYMDEKEMKSLLGHSLSFVYPKDRAE